MVDLSKRLADLSPAKRRLLEQRLKEKPGVTEPIAIVGMSCRFGGAPNLQAYWRLIRDGIDGTGEIPNWRWDVDGLYDPTGEQSGKMSVKWAGMVEDVDKFDPVFFGISPREAMRMDPQQRMLLEVSWEALEIGGLAPESMCGTATGVFVGIGGTDYSKIPCQFEDYYSFIDAHVGTGNALSIAANRVSYVFDLRGPSVAVDTACSSGMVGVHLAVQSLRNGECDAALAGGVNAILTPETTIAFSKAQMLSSDGKCRPFDDGANGYVRGEGCAMIVMKRLTDAMRDGDNVLAVIRGTASNQDGRTSGITAPNGLSQQRVIRAALKDAGLSLEQVNYIEAHGTGTPLGDPIEVQALAELFRRRNDDEFPCYVTSVKANIGHTETVSGVAGIIKVVLMMQHGLIPAQLHLQKLNPHISLDGTRLRIPSESVGWDTGDQSRVAGVSSFGFGGTNTHVVLESASPVNVPETIGARPINLLALSAKSKPALERLADSYLECLDSNPELSATDFCYSANAGRSHFNHRVVIQSASRGDLIEKLSAVAKGERAKGVKAGQVKLASAPKIAMLFTGQGSQYTDMGRELYDTCPSFRNAINNCDAILRDHLPHSLLSVMYPGLKGSSDIPPETINETAYTQPALFAVEYALATLWRSWGIEPSVLIGHSVGEYVAATIAGVMSLEDGLKLLARRAALMQALPPNGLMAVIFAPADAVKKSLSGHEDQVSIAAANGPENTVISGEADSIRRMVESFEAAGTKTQLLTVSHAFHSPLMDPMLDEFEACAETIEYHRPQIPIISNLTGDLITDEPPRAGYWRSHIRNTVRFAGGMAKLAEQGVDVMLEAGPAPVLLGMGRRCLTGSKASWLPSLRKGQPDWKVMTGSLTDLYLTGTKVNWKGFDRDWPRRRLILPTYPFERNRFWFENDAISRPMFAGSHGRSVHPLLGSRLPSALPSNLYELRLSCRSPRFLVDHQVQDSPVVPAAAFVEQGLAAAREAFGDGRHAVNNIVIGQAMFLPQGTSRVVQVALSAESGGQSTFETYSVPADADDPNTRWTLHARGTLQHADAVPAGTEPRDHFPTLKTDDTDATVIDLEDVRSRVIDVKSKSEFYQIMRERGLDYGPEFQVLKDLQRTGHDGVAEVDLPESIGKQLGDYLLHPALGDACFQSVAGVVPLETDGSYSPYTYMPAEIERVRFRGELCERMYTYAVRTSDDDQPSPESVRADVFLVDENGRVLVELTGVRVQRVGRRSSGGDVDVRDWLYRVEWQQEEETQQESGGRSQGAKGTWLVFADENGVGERLVHELHDREMHCALVAPGESFRVTTEENGDAALYHINPLSGEDYRRLLAEATSERYAGIVHLWSLDIAGDAENPDDARRLGCGSVLQLMREIPRARLAKSPSLHLVTQGAQSLDDNHAACHPAQAPLWGLGRVAAMENPELQCRLVDADPSASVEQIADQLLAEILDPSAESQIAFRGNDRFAARLRRCREAIPATGSNQTGTREIPKDAPFRLRLAEPGRFDSLWFEVFDRKPPEAGQVELEVHSAGLNFSDVLKAMGLYPGIKDDIVPLGIECSGVVTAVGEGVDRFQPGDEVMGVVPYCFSSHARTAEYTLVHKPAALDHSEAATIPITFLTAYYALVRLAQLQKGERVLIHAGAGGVGLAAIQIAQHIGAEVFATAGSDEKREFLKQLGVEHVMNSRTLDFADDVMRITGREGIDVVLNSLPGDAITKSLSCLRGYGRFLEIGKTDIYKNTMIGLAPFQDNLSYFAIDLDRMLRQRGDTIRAMFGELMEFFDNDSYQPLAFTEFPIDDVVGAFRYMQQRKNIGKVVVTVESEGSGEASEVRGQESEVAAREPDELVCSDGTYLITGGLGALGLRVADWLGGEGAKHVVLMSRRAPDEDVQNAIDSLAEKEIQIVAIQGDVTEADSLQNALTQIPADFPPLRGVIHAAGVLADGLLFDMDLAQFDKAMAPKVQGAWNLHTATIDSPLDFFVLFSSVASVLGSPGQGNYAAGNAFLDGLAHFRRSQGLPALSINWGPWADSGMAAATGSEQIRARGMEMLPPDEALNVLGRLLKSDETNVAVMDARWSDLLKMMSGRVPPMLNDVADAEAKESGAEAGAGVDHELRQELLGANLDERQSKLREYFTDELARIMGLESDDLDQTQPLNELGMDSLLGMELKNNLETTLGFTMPMAAFLETPSITTLSEHAAKALADDGETARDVVDVTIETWSPLVTLKEQGDNLPLFCIHPLGGDVSCYFDLARHVQDRPVYALRGRGNEGQLKPHDSMNEMLSDYLKAMKSIQATGPYHLASWSAGGIFSYELARMLHAQSDEVALLALLDTPLPSIYENVALDDDVKFLFDLGNFTNWFAGSDIDVDSVTYEQLNEMDEDTRWEFCLAIAKHHNAVPPDASADHLRCVVAAGKSHATMIKQYAIEPFDLAVDLIRPADPDVLAKMTGQRLDHDLGWQAVHGDRLKIHETPGDHFSMMVGDNALSLAKRLAERLVRQTAAS